MLKNLLEQILPNEPVAFVTTDGDYHTKACHAVLVQRGTMASITRPKNGKPWKENQTGAAVRNEILRAVSRLGQKLWKK